LVNKNSLAKGSKQIYWTLVQYEYGCPNFQSRENLIVVSGQKRWIFLPGIGSPGKVGDNGIQVLSFAIYRRDGFLLCHNFARTIRHYVFESVKSAAESRR
jgi:hypothetical protein